MREFIFTLLGVSLVAGFASMLTPEGKGGGLRSYLGFACGLCALSVAVGPILSFIGVLAEDSTDFFGGISDGAAVYDYEKIFDETLAVEGEEAVEIGLKSILCGEFGIKEENADVDVKLGYNGDSLTAESVTVTLRGKAVLIDAHGIAERVTSLLSCECRVVYGGKNDTEKQRGSR